MIATNVSGIGLRRKASPDGLKQSNSGSEFAFYSPTIIEMNDKTENEVMIISHKRRERMHKQIEYF